MQYNREVCGIPLLQLSPGSERDRHVFHTEGLQKELINLQVRPGLEREGKPHTAARLGQTQTAYSTDLASMLGVTASPVAQISGQDNVKYALLYHLSYPATWATNDCACGLRCHQQTSCVILCGRTAVSNGGEYGDTVIQQKLSIRLSRARVASADCRLDKSTFL